MFYADIPLVHGMVVITVVVGLERILVRVTQHNRRVERLIESEPVLLVSDGNLLREALEHEDLSEAEVFMGLRDKGIEFLGEVRRAYIEPSGRLSVFRAENPVDRGRSILPEQLDRN